MTVGIQKLINATNPDEVKMVLDKLYAAVQELQGVDTGSGTVGGVGMTIKSIQRGTIAVTSGGTTGNKSNTATVTAVVVENSILIHLGSHNNSQATTGFNEARIELTDTTTITAYSYCLTNVAATITVGYELIEYE